MSFDVAAGRFTSSYPWNENRYHLEYNKPMAFAVMKSTEKQLQRKGKQYTDLYSSQIVDMIDRKAAREVTEAELQNYHGQKYFLTHLAIEKPDSKTTPFRIVFNSSARYKGYSLNDCLLKGPSLLNALFGVLQRYRLHPYAYVGDLSKMFHSINIPYEDQMMHLFLWRFNPDEDPKVFAMTALNMGDRPASTIAQICLKKAAEDAVQQYPEASVAIIENSYMDDILGSSPTASERDRTTCEISHILQKKGFHIKEWLLNSNHDERDDAGVSIDIDIKIVQEDNELLKTENVLGMKWNMGKDTLSFKVVLPYINIDTITVTLRNIVKVVKRIFDPLGLLSPFIVKCKIVLRMIYATEPKLSWDDPVPMDIECEWKRILLELPDISKLTFHRSITPPNAVGDPQLIIFSDGAKPAYGAVAYARWKTEDGGFNVRIIAAKNRVAPLKIENIVRLELCGAVIGARLHDIITKELTSITFQKVIHIVDSEIVHAMVHKESYGFNTFAANRIGEIQRKSSPHEYAWTPSKLNISDLLTRGCSPALLGEGSEWQEPSFLKEDETLWPVKHEINKNIDIPERKKESHVIATVQNVDSLATRINIERFSKLYKLLNTTAMILKLYTRFKQNGENSTQLRQTDLQIAETFWIREAQKGLDVHSKQLRKFRPRVNNENVIVVGGRTERWMESTWNRQFFILLPKTHHISLLIARREHALVGHLGRDATISKIRSVYWILGVRSIVENIIKDCVLCKLKAKKLQEQSMAPLAIKTQPTIYKRYGRLFWPLYHTWGGPKTC